MFERSHKLYIHQTFQLDPIDMLRHNIPRYLIVKVEIFSLIRDQRQGKKGTAKML